ncbi:MAG TPA: hypothetical protein VGX48_19995 [Pyrinomonadaceae bacterium]|nr:hypothetical protein [Pyrinomonadaceae bacterium]
MPRPTVRSTVWRRRPKAEPAADCVYGRPGWRPEPRVKTGAASPFAEVGLTAVSVGRPTFRDEDGRAKFVLLKRLKISVRNSSLVVSPSGMRLLKMRSACQKSGPRRALRGRSPNSPAEGMAKAAGFRRLRSLLR